MIQIKARGRTISVTHNEPIFTGTFERVEVAFEIPHDSPLLDGALVASFRAVNKSGAVRSGRANLSVQNIAVVPDCVLREPAVSLEVGLLSTDSAGRQTATNMAKLGKVVIGAGGSEYGPPHQDGCCEYPGFGRDCGAHGIWKEDALRLVLSKLANFEQTLRNLLCKFAHLKDEVDAIESGPPGPPGPAGPQGDKGDPGGSGALPPGAITRRALRPGTDYNITWGARKILLPRNGAKLNIQAFEYIDLQEPQGFDVSSYLLISNFLETDPEHLDLSAWSLRGYGGQTGPNVTAVDSCETSGSLAGGDFKITAALQVQGQDDTRARFDVALAIDLVSGVALNLTVTPLTEWFVLYFYGFDIGVENYPALRDVYALSFDFRQPFGPLDEFDCGVEADAPELGILLTAYLLVKRGGPIAVVVPVGNVNIDSVAVVWEGDAVHLLVDDGGNHGYGSGLRPEQYDFLFSLAEFKNLVKTEVCAGG